jgi:predicted lipid-binding transport protein (Tim44 family)
LTVTLWLGLLLARAGGGHGFGGGESGGGLGGSGGGFGGGGSGVGHGGFFFLPIGGVGGGLTFFLIIAVIVLVIGFAAARRRSPPVQPPFPDENLGRPTFPSPPGSAAAPPAHDQVADGLAAIQAHDPDFDKDAFIAAAERAFFTVQQAWTERKPEMSRQVMADGIWQQHRVQIEGYQRSGRENVLQDLSIGAATIIGASSDQTHDTITVRFLAACADYDIDVSSGKVVRGNKSVGQWSEDWVFQRSSSATTKADGGTMQQRCPNCGAPLDLDLAGVCHYCKAPVMSGSYDWVLTRIDQVLGPAQAV